MDEHFKKHKKYVSQIKKIDRKKGRRDQWGEEEDKNEKDAEQPEEATDEPTTNEDKP